MDKLHLQFSYKSAALKQYRQVRCKVVKCQASIRMWLSLRRLNILSKEVSSSLQRYSKQLGPDASAVDATLTQPLIRLQKQLNALTTLQSKWGVFAIKRCEFKTKEERLLEDWASTKVSSWWKTVHYRAVYKKAVRGMCKCYLLCTTIFILLSNEYPCSLRYHHLSINRQAQSRCGQSRTPLERIPQRVCSYFNSSQLQSICCN